MASFNQVILMGNLTRDPVLRYTPSQMAVCDFGVACNRKFKGANGEEREEVTFVDVTAWGKQAEIINQYFSKGKPIFLQGRLKLDQWEDKQGGGKRSKLTVVLEQFQFVGGREGGQRGGEGSPPQEYSEDRPQARAAAPPRPAPVRSAPDSQAPASQSQDQPAPPYGDEQQFKEDDIPF